MNDDTARRLRLLDDVFRPSAPIDRKDLFRGRSRQLLELFDVMHTRGQHGVIYGERGVGKTSIATVAGEMYESDLLTVRIACDATDTFATIWEKLIGELRYFAIADGCISSEQVETVSELLLDTDTSPQSVKLALRYLSRDRPVAIFVDEFDRVPSESTHTMMADTIKALSDDIVEATLVVVGVADDVDSLISEHESIDRALVQVRMPRMNIAEIAEIIDSGLATLDLTIDDTTLRKTMQTLPQGLPEYAHRLAQAAARNAILRDSQVLSEADFGVALGEVLDARSSR